MKTIDYKKLGEKIKQKRKSKGYTQERLAEICDISTGFLGHIENGTRYPALDTLFNIASALDSGVDYFLLDSAENGDAFLAQVAETVRDKNSESYDRFCKTVKLLAEHIDEL